MSVIAATIHKWIYHITNDMDQCPPTHPDSPRTEEDLRVLGGHDQNSTATSFVRHPAGRRPPRIRRYHTVRGKLLHSEEVPQDRRAKGQLDTGYLHLQVSLRVDGLSTRLRGCRIPNAVARMDVLAAQPDFPVHLVACRTAWESSRNLGRDRGRLDAPSPGTIYQVQLTERRTESIYRAA